VTPFGAAPGVDVAEPPVIAAKVFGPRLALAQRYAEFLAGPGLERGLLGPREVPRLWTRHLLNSAVISDLLPPSATVLDVGSGAGLPGIALAIRRPDLRIVLLEPMVRRTTFLREVVTALDPGSQVSVVRGRAGEPHAELPAGSFKWIVARAVAPLDRLVRWTAPLLAPGGRLLAMKGATVQDEVDTHSSRLAQLGMDDVQIIEVDADGIDPTWVASLRRAGRPVRGKGRRR
jgi:16S rRNA (guanine527-N7)-methyltransferase